MLPQHLAVLLLSSRAFLNKDKQHAKAHSKVGKARMCQMMRFDCHCRVGNKVHALPRRNVRTCSILSGHARTVPRLHVEQANKQTPEVGSSDLVAIGRGNSSAKAEPMQLRFQHTILYSRACTGTCTAYMPLREGWISLTTQGSIGPKNFQFGKNYTPSADWKLKFF